jgi:hypothetical protein
MPSIAHHLGIGTGTRVEDEEESGSALGPTQLWENRILEISINTKRQKEYLYITKLHADV